MFLQGNNECQILFLKVNGAINPLFVGKNPKLQVRTR